MMQLLVLLQVFLLVAVIFADQSAVYISPLSKLKQRQLKKWLVHSTPHIEASEVIAKITERTSKRAISHQIAAVALPALAVCIVEPALSLIDMYFVVRSPSTNPALALTAMSVNNAIFNIIAAATYPLCTGTTAMVSKCLANVVNLPTPTSPNT
ncbi:hypothetical protein EON65_37510, partial [archaeon]